MNMYKALILGVESWQMLRDVADFTGERGGDNLVNSSKIDFFRIAVPERNNYY